MIFHYICNDCLIRASGKPVDDLTVDEYRHLCAKLYQEVRHKIGEKPEIKCDRCSGCNIVRLSSVEESFTRGYGLLDKAGVVNDMNLHTILTGNDPYKEHRQRGDTTDLVNKLRGNKNFKPKQSNVFL